MKKLFIALVAVSMPLALQAAHGPGGGGPGGGGLGGGGLGGGGLGGGGLGGGKIQIIQNAKQLAQTLKQISNRSQKVSQRVHDFQKSRQLQRVSNISARLSQQVRQVVVRPLKNGAPKRRVAQNLQSLQFQFQRLNQVVNRIYILPPGLQGLIAQGKQLYKQLKRKLNKVGPGQGNGNVVCEAKDMGFEEHFFQKHLGFGKNVNVAQRKAIQSCQLYHGRCQIIGCKRGF